MRQHMQWAHPAGSVCVVLLFALAGLSACGDDNADPATSDGSTVSAVEDQAAQGDGESTETVEDETSTVEDQAAQGDGESTETVEDETSATVTAVTTGMVTADVVLDLATGEPDPDAEPGFEVEVTMDDGSPRMIPADMDTMNVIFPDGKTAEGVRVTIDVVGGEERITGLAE